MGDIFQIIFYLYAVLSFIMLIFLFFKKNNDPLNDENRKEILLLKDKVSDLGRQISDEFRGSRGEISQNLRENREELQFSFKNLGETNSSIMRELSSVQSKNFELFSVNLRDVSEQMAKQIIILSESNDEKLKNMQSLVSDTLNEIKKEQMRYSKDIDEKMEKLRDGIYTSLENFNVSMQSSFKSNRSELGDNFERFGKVFSDNVKNFNDNQNTRFGEILLSNKEQRDMLEKKLEDINISVVNNLDKLRIDNERKLEEMRKTVDEKLHESLEKRLSESFKQVSDRLEQVHRGLGEMQSLAADVGGLKKTLNNVKNRGVLGEIQLEKILEQILTQSQFQKNVKTKPNSGEHVEFAIVLPGNEDGKNVWLPLDAKFPVEDYHELLDMYEKAEPSGILESSKKLEQRIKGFAKSIRDKYIEPPYTTDFGIMFLPFEGLYSEVLRINGLFEYIQREYKIVITGPTTMAAFLNSLQMGFRTLTIEKSAGEIMRILGVVKNEFNKFGDTLEKAQKKIKDASENIDELVGTRTKKIQNALKNVTELNESSTDLGRLGL